MGSQVGFPVFQPQLLPDIIPVNIDRPGGYIQQIRDFLGRASLSDEGDDLDFHGGEIGIF